MRPQLHVYLPLSVPIKWCDILAIFHRWCYSIIHIFSIIYMYMDLVFILGHATKYCTWRLYFLLHRPAAVANSKGEASIQETFMLWFILLFLVYRPRLLIIHCTHVVNVKLRAWTGTVRVMTGQIPGLELEENKDGATRHILKVFSFGFPFIGALFEQFCVKVYACWWSFRL